MLTLEQMFRTGKAGPTKPRLGGASVRRQGPRATAIAAAAVLAVSLTACGTDDTDDDPEIPNRTATSPPESPDDNTDDGSDNAEGNLDDHHTGLVTAGRTAEQAVNGSRVISIDLDDGLWKVEVATSDGVEHEMEIARDGSDVTDGPSEDDTDDDDRRDNTDRLDAAQIDHEAAARAVIETIDEGQIEEMSLDTDDGTVVWDVELRGGSDYHVDASTGEVSEQ